ncbi:MAG: DUF2142 domain-containing protein [Janthinobacterium lividum]
MPEAAARQPLLTALFVLSVLFYMVVIPPFEVRDESAHFAKAVQLATGSFPTISQAGQPGAMLPAGVGALLRAYPFDAPNTATTRRSVPLLLRDLGAPADPLGPAVFVDFAYIGSYLPAFYLPQLPGLAIGRGLGLSPLGVFYAGRLSAGLVGIALVLTAVSIIPYGRRSLLVIAVLPGTASQFASYSADSLLFGLSFLLIAILVRNAVQPTRMRTGLAAVLMPCMILFKGVYLPMAAAGLGRAHAWRPRTLLPMVAGAVAGVLLFGGWLAFAGGQINAQHYQSRRTLLPMVTSPPGEQVSFILAHPVTAGTAILSSIVERLPVFAVDWIGRFGYFNVFLPWPAYGLGVFVLLLAAGATRDSSAGPCLAERGLWLAIAAAVFVLVHLALYVTATALGETYVEGVQGRYFLPVLPLVVLACRFTPRPVLARAIDAGLPLLAGVLAAAGLAKASLAFWSW